MLRKDEEDAESLLPRPSPSGAASRSTNISSIRTVTLVRNAAIAAFLVVLLFFIAHKQQPGLFSGLSSSSASNISRPAALDDSHVPAHVEPEPVVKRPTFNTSKTAVLLENRDLPELVTILHNFLTKVPEDWPFRVFCGEANEGPLRRNRLLKPYLDSGRLSLTRLHDESLIHGQLALSQFLASPWLWEQLVPAEHIFLFQADTVICSKSENTLDDWLGFDAVPGGYAWVGAPWAFAPGRRVGGNGGFSLRRRSIVLNITKTWEWEVGVPEDLWFARILERDYNPLMPTFYKALTFSFENPPQEVWNSDATFHTYGVHVGHYWSQCPYPQNVARLLEYCHDARLIIDAACLPMPG